MPKRTACKRRRLPRHRRGREVDTRHRGVALTTNNNLDRAPFIQALVSRAMRLGSSANIEQLIEQAEAQILAGGGEATFLTSAGGNGKSAMAECRMDAAEMFTLATQALDRYNAAAAAGGGTPHNGPAVSTTYADFSCLSGFGGSWIPNA